MKYTVYLMPAFKMPYGFKDNYSKGIQPQTPELVW